MDYLSKLNVESIMGPNGMQTSKHVLVARVIARPLSVI